MECVAWKSIVIMPFSYILTELSQKKIYINRIKHNVISFILVNLLFFIFLLIECGYSYLS